MTPASSSLPRGDHWFDDGLYTSVNELAHRSPGWLDTAVSLWSTYGLVLLGALLMAAWWRARPVDPARAALALAAPLVVVAAFVVSTALKALLREQRPCQTLRTVTVEACPALGDWSLPSNHAVLAAAVATTLLFTDRRLAALAVPAAVAMAASRVWVGAHYPHDVVLGLVVGAAVAGALMAGARRAAAPVAERLQATRLRPPVAKR
ncbi:phosphatase PAP2 family protein [Streptomyces sp. JV176]|uniref:phosphatase PAP2 family protein n=1 Tax=Streptomyces sp. JV176 TaxID=858630 RepID=UPI002E75A127|nr:phosphatase PAP2 family protein [Streptomyces sp. JV176]MEE1801360.1 phosphatase PAP2 family protein [Streptomyces sp. JV176]